jgi:hypothetical protein
MITLNADIHALIKQFLIVAGVKVGRTLVCGAGHLRVGRTCDQSYDEQNSDASHEASCALFRPVDAPGIFRRFGLMCGSRCGFTRSLYRFPMTQKPFPILFSTALVAVTGFWLWFLLANADQVFRLIHYLSR